MPVFLDMSKRFSLLRYSAETGVYSAITALSSAAYTACAAFLIGDIALVTQSGSTILLANGCGPHDGAKC